MIWSGFKKSSAKRSTLSAAFLLCVMMIGCSSYKQRDVPKHVGIAPPTASASSTRPTTGPTTVPVFNVSLDAFPMPPIGWRIDRDDKTDRHSHTVWVSPTGQTAYGVLFFRLPFPVGHELALSRGFFPQMRREAGSLNIISQFWDDNIEGIRFEVDAGIYRMRATFFVRGMRGWAVYAGTKREATVVESELKLAEWAREQTVVDPKK
jgi:hypothetical protein